MEGAIFVCTEREDHSNPWCKASKIPVVKKIGSTPGPRAAPLMSLEKYLGIGIQVIGVIYWFFSTA